LRKLYILLFILFPFIKLIGQVNYLEVKEKLKASCGEVYLKDLFKDKALVDSIMQFEIIVGEEKFLYDAGMIYYLMYLKGKNKEDIIKSTEFNQKCWDKYGNLNALWNLGSNYGILQDCDKKIELTERYISEMKKDSLEEFIDYQQIYLRYKSCRNQ
jgi:hypothetical protein